MLFFYFDSLILFYELKSVMSHIGCSRHEWVGVLLPKKINFWVKIWLILKQIEWKQLNNKQIKFKKTFTYLYGNYFWLQNIRFCFVFTPFWPIFGSFLAFGGQIKPSKVQYILMLNSLRYKTVYITKILILDTCKSDLAAK